MNNLTPNYLLPSVLIGALSTTTAILFGIHKALQLAGWPTSERKRAVWNSTLLLGAWFIAALVPSWLGFYDRPLFGLPTIQYGMIIPLIVAVMLFRGSATLRRVVEAIPQSWLVCVQVYRTEGVIFLVLYATGHLPGVFAWPAGAGDMLVGLLAPVVAIAYARHSRSASVWVRAWNLFGIADFVVAVTIGFLSTPGPLQKLSLEAPNKLITAFPLAMVPAFIIPLSILLHLASLTKVGQRQIEREVRDPLLA
jgi:hypothetical protein